ncbi:breast cancer metastasis-suppressor 1 isoform X1 [Camelus ferus]|uniref:Breast cancer metastasis-suppressor 1 isoform X1 n=2 Tax=Camelus TaxID=9836 RepID=A0A8B8TV57_CAMFR|nr:breast cancer metastasis-suppressor 1 isoform X1 [Camelus dromedarius]XP_031303818.1 breast cancer metastasis-suppressor 1 isoform X1 [Camelus dromedarius]XP_031303819.1 breast cancer metastasis-suppressor 1 isoform X1 [Camelus dromedarius]XP_032345788.1 breast cancer metastasis-suppressor 1 isoform X1 [Camelus ferus]XP_032345789.1 breast cancer metastasis-suppressor 1 isoform X1 [Camelus ferus]XP_032345790.1 breast cancer metastasis-suppressor 1 isoform X1 [Camelus ferus]XP_045373823.1 br
MPIQPPSKDTEEMEAEGDSAAEMNGEEEESEEEQSGSQTESEEESSEMDDEDYERRRSECVSEMLDLEKQFSELKEKLFRERLSQLRVRLEEVGAERAPEYTEPLGGLQRSLKIRIQVAGIYKGFCLDVIRNKYECELQGAKQHLESEKLLLYDTLQGELQERIQRLEEDRQSLDISSEWWDDKLHARGSSKTWDSLPPSKRKKAPLVSAPCPAVRGTPLLSVGAPRPRPITCPIGQASCFLDPCCRPLHRVHAAGDRHPGGLDGYQKGKGSCVPSEEKIRWTLTLLFTARGPLGAAGIKPRIRIFPLQKSRLPGPSGLPS